MALEEREKKMLMGLGAAAGVLVLFFLFKMLTGGEDPAATDPAAVPPDVTAPADPAAPTTTDPATTSPAPSTTQLNGFVFTARDFFSPIPEPIIVDLSATPSPSPGGSTGITPDNVNIDGHEVVLNSIIARKIALANVAVDGASFSVAASESFADGFTVLTIDTSISCSKFEYKSGSVQDEFTLCVT